VTTAGVAQVDLGGRESRVGTGLVVLDRLLEELAGAGGFGLTLEIAPDEPDAEVGRAGAALGEALAPLLEGAGAAGRGFGVAPADEALAMVVLERSTRPLVVSNADLSSTRAGGLQADLPATVLDELARAAGLTIHVRLIEGESSQHVLSAIFKALGIALAEALRRSGSLLAQDYVPREDL
jgi:imidazoleglycerol-phosphate dehydratase